MNKFKFQVVRPSSLAFETELIFLSSLRRHEIDHLLKKRIMIIGMQEQLHQKAIGS